MRKKNIAFIVAHPDDETIGCGGTILKKIAERNNVSLLVLSNGISSRSKNKKDLSFRIKNFYKALKSYKIKNFELLNYPDNQFDSIALLNKKKKIESFLKKNNPSEIYTHYFDELNIDHYITSKAVVTAARPKPFIYKKNIYV